MSMGESVMRIDMLENGYKVEVCDPDIMEANNSPKSEYESPWKSYAFSTAPEVIAFVTATLEKLKPPPDATTEYASAFKQATKGDAK
jgi:hypothetical protein